ncbi:hydrolase activity protein [[Candida] boidinii]|nr:hydrolase activity protein [[Candida] boidinii]
MPSVSPFKITEGRLINTIHETANLFGAKGQWGPNALTDTGCCRLALSDEDKGVRDWFVKELESLGCKVKIDEVGSIFGIYPGENNDEPPTAIGSHLDTQPTGGRYDGILGVLSGLEVLRTFKDSGYTPKYPVAVISWMNEEGARFPMSIMASSVWSGALTKEEIYQVESITDLKPVKVIDELNRIGYVGKTPASYLENPIYAHFELHIEQGPILEENSKEIGVVQGVQAYVWYDIYVTGKAQHTGTTPLVARNDTLLTVSKMIVKANEIAHKYDGLCSVGTLSLEPGSINVIPGEVHFTLDIRHQYDDKLKLMEAECKEEFEAIAKGPNGSSTKEAKVRFEHIYTQPSVHFHEDCIKCVEESAIEIFGEDKILPIISGAGHDSCPTSSRVPTSMIFIPCRDGVSHNFEEYSTPEQVDNGFRTLLGAVTKFDLLRAERKMTV